MVGFNLGGLFHPQRFYDSLKHIKTWFNSVIRAEKSGTQKSSDVKTKMCTALISPVSNDTSSITLREVTHSTQTVPCTCSVDHANPLLWWHSKWSGLLSPRGSAQSCTLSLLPAVHTQLLQWRYYGTTLCSPSISQWFMSLSSSLEADLSPS